MHPEAMIATLKSLKLFGMAHDCMDAGGATLLPNKVHRPGKVLSRSSTACSKPRWPSARCARLTTKPRLRASPSIVTGQRGPGEVAASRRLH